MISSLISTPITFSQEVHYSGTGWFALIGIALFMVTLIGSINILVGGVKNLTKHVVLIIATVLICGGSFALAVFGLGTFVAEGDALTVNNEKALTNWVDQQYGIKLTQSQTRDLYYSSDSTQVTDAHGKPMLVQLEPVPNTKNTYVLYSVGQPTPLNQK